MEKQKESSSFTFWEHLDELRSLIVKVIVAVVLFGVAAFIFKDQLFAIVLAPKEENFITYDLFRFIGEKLSLGEFAMRAFSVPLINTGLAGQFLIHVRVALYAGLLIASPYILYQLFRFISPALYVNEKKYALRLVGSGYLMFLIGVLLCYLLIFPLTFRFLGTYQVSVEIPNMITLHSYIDTLMMLCLMMGIVFEIPVLCWLFAKFGLLTPDFMRKYRRHAIVIILVIAAIITPTADIFTLLLVALPVYLLYEASILIVRNVKKRN